MGRGPLDGGEGQDLVQGGDGADILVGDLGADRFVVNPAFEVPRGMVATDRITDLAVGRDKMGLCHYSPDPAWADHDHVVFHGKTAFIAHIAAQLRVTQTATDTVMRIGAHATVGGVFYRIILTGLLDLTAADFILWRW